MTTSESAGVPVQQPAAEIPAQRSATETDGVPAQRSAPEAEAADRESGPQATGAEVTADKRETAPLTGRVVAPANDPKQLEAEIERTRQQLGETVQELASRVDVRSRARAKAAELSGRMKTTTLQARQNAASRAGGVRSQVTNRTAAVRQRATSAGAGGRDQLRNRAAAVGAPVWQATPEPVRRAVTKGANGARERWMLLAGAAGVLIVGYLAVRKWGGRSPASDQSSELDSSRQVRVRTRRVPAPDPASGPDSSRQVRVRTRRVPASDLASEADSSPQVTVWTRRVPVSDPANEPDSSLEACSARR